MKVFIERKKDQHYLIVGLSCLFFSALFTSMFIFPFNYFGLCTLILIMFYINLIPFIVSYFRGWKDSLELVHIVSLYFIIQFVLRPIYLFLNPDTNHFISSNVLTTMNSALLIQILGVTLFYLGYYVIPYVRKGKVTLFQKQSCIVPLYKIMTGFLFIWFCRVLFFIKGNAIVYIVDVNSSSSGGLMGIVGQISQMGSIIIALTYSQYIITTKNKNVLTKYLCFFILLEICWSFFIGSKTILVQMLFALIITYNYTKKRISFKKILNVGLVIILLVFPIIEIIRDVSLFELSSKHQGIAYFTIITGSLFQYLSNPIESIGIGLQALIMRMDNIDNLILSLNFSSNNYPYVGGSHYLLLPFMAIIPAIIWPNKPSIEIGVAFGNHFREVNENLDIHYAVGILAELVLSFGLIPALLGMFIWGVFYKIIYISFINDGSKYLSSPALIIYSSLFLRLIYVEQNIFDILNVLIKWLIVLIPYYIWIKGKSRGIIND